MTGTVHVDQAWVDEALGAVVYRVRVVEGSSDRALQKRFSDFHALHSHLALREGFSELQRLGMPVFPRKKLTGNRDTGLIESRRSTFERCAAHFTYWCHIVDFCKLVATGSCECEFAASFGSMPGWRLPAACVQMPLHCKLSPVPRVPDLHRGEGLKWLARGKQQERAVS